MMPELNEIVIVKAVKVLDYGVIVELVEYPDIEGFVHISHVSPGWVKNIRNFVREDQIRAAAVLGIDPEKKQVEVSFKKISSEEERVRIEQWKQFKRSKMLIEILAKSHKKSFDDVWKAVAEPLSEEYGSLTDAFKEVAIRKEEAVKAIPEEWRAPLMEVVSKNIIIPVRTIKAVLSVKSLQSNGVTDIKEALKIALKPVKPNALQVSYLGAGKFSVRALSHDYKDAEREIKAFRETVVRELERRHAQAEFLKE